MIGSVTDGARDYLDFVGFQNSLNILIDALERRYGKGQTTNKIQQQFYQLSQERGETVQEFAGRIETKYNKKPMGFMQSCCDLIIYFIYSL